MVLPKSLIGVLLVLIFFWEWRQGYFKGLKSRIRNFAGATPLFRPPFVLSSLLVLAGLVLLDPRLLKFFHSLEGPAPALLAGWGSAMGKNHYFWTALIAFYFLSYLFVRRGVPGVAFGIIFSAAVSGTVAHGLKYVFLRARPDSNFGAYHFLNWDGLLQDKRMFQSFPSGDVALVAGAAGFLFFSVKNRVLRWGALLLPFATALGRMDLNRHWPSDTFASILIGLVIAGAVARKNHENPA